MENSNGAVVGSNKDYVPPKMWKDLNADEKIERMRNEIKNFSWRLSNVQTDVNNLKNDFQNHAHLNDKVVKDIKTMSNLLGGIGSALRANPQDESEGNVYF